MNLIPTEVSENILQYMLGGHATFCVKQDATETSDGGQVWYTIYESSGGAYETTYFVYKVDGNKSYYAGYFTYNDLGKLKSLRESKKKKEVDDSVSKPLCVVLNSLKNKGVLPGNGIVHIYSDGRCSVCKRRLTDFNSIKDGVGPECRKKLMGMFQFR